jgi:hypothetical protein
VKILIEFRGAPGAGGRPTASRKTVTADWIRVGRNASCELHLPDPREPEARLALELGPVPGDGRRIVAHRAAEVQAREGPGRGAPAARREAVGEGGEQPALEDRHRSRL